MDNEAKYRHSLSEADGGGSEGCLGGGIGYGVIIPSIRRFIRAYDACSGELGGRSDEGGDGGVAGEAYSAKTRGEEESRVSPVGYDIE